MLIPVAGSKQETEVVVEVVDVVVVHVIAVLLGAVFLLQEISPKVLPIKTKTARRLTAPLSLASRTRSG